MSKINGVNISKNMPEFRHIGKNVVIRDWVRISRPENIWIGDNVVIDDFVLLSGGRDGNLLEIHDHVHIAAFASINGSAGCVFEYGSAASHGSRIFNSVDDYVDGALINPTFPEELRHQKEGKVVFGEFSCIGANTVVLPGIKIGAGATTGAGSVVIKDLEPWGIYAGVPAKFIKWRNKEEAYRRIAKLSDYKP